MTLCANCAVALLGEFCHACGQKRFVEGDRRFGHLLGQLLESVTDLDGRIWRTVRALLLRPGLLSREYMAGRRAHWIGPVALFLAVNVAYFVAPLRGGDFVLQFNQQVSGRIRALAAEPGTPLSEEDLAASGRAHARFTMDWIDERVRARDLAARAASSGARGYDHRDYRRAYDAKADDVSKALIILHVPLVALVLMVLFAPRRRYFAEHFVVVLHYVTFLILVLQLAVQGYLAMRHALPSAWLPPLPALNAFIRILLPVYLVLALRRAYAVGWAGSIGAAAVVLPAMMLVNMYLYHSAVFLLTFALT